MPDGPSPDDVSRADWTALMVRAQAGDEAAYNTVLKAMVPVIRSVVRRRIGDHGLVEDVVQDVLLTIHRVRATYDPARPIGAWLYTIASARTIDALRRHGRRWGREVHDDVAMASHADADAVQRMDAGSTARELNGLLGQLPERQRRMVEMVHLQEMSLSDAAATSQLSVSAVKALLHRAITTLRQYGAKDHG